MLPLFALLAGADGSIVAASIGHHPIRLHVCQKLQCVLPLIALSTSTDGSIVAASARHQPTYLHIRQKLKRVLRADWERQLLALKTEISTHAMCLLIHTRTAHASDGAVKLSLDRAAAQQQQAEQHAGAASGDGGGAADGGGGLADAAQGVDAPADDLESKMLEELEALLDEERCETDDATIGGALHAMQASSRDLLRALNSSRSDSTASASGAAPPARASASLPRPTTARRRWRDSGRRSIDGAWSPRTC